MVDVTADPDQQALLTQCCTWQCCDDRLCVRGSCRLTHAKSSVEYLEMRCEQQYAQQTEDPACRCANSVIEYIMCMQIWVRGKAELGADGEGGQGQDREKMETCTIEQSSRRAKTWYVKR